MALSFSDLKKFRENNVNKISDQLTKMVSKQNFKEDDDRFWYPDVDKAGNGFAVIRFLPEVKGEDFPFVRLFQHSFQGPTGSWYIENSLTTLSKPDPVSEHNTFLWNTGVDADKEIARKQKRKLVFISNILVVKDPANPKNEGKVFLFKYGKKLYDKLNEMMNPTTEGEEKVNPFDFWEGCNLKLKIKTVANFRNYDSSMFEPKSPVAKTDEEIETIWNSQYPLKPFVAEDQFKPYDELTVKLNRVLGLNGATAKPVENVAQSTSKTEKPKELAELDEEDDDASLSYFQNLAKE